MPLFRKRVTPCPICEYNIDASGNKMDHWLGHVFRIESGECVGGFSWRCMCGPSDMYWAKDIQAASGLALHMMQRHAISI